MNPDISIIIPAYYEEAIIGKIVGEVQEVMDATSYSYELLVINDGSDDNTAVNAEAAGAKVVSHPYNIGNGAAVKTGIRHAQGNHILMMDADGQHPPKIIPQLLEASRTYDMVVGARTSESDSAIHRDIANIIYNKLASYITNFKIEDLTSGFRIIKRDIANEFLYLLPNQFSYPTTLTLSVIRAGYNLNYIPFAAPKRVGKSKIKLLRDGSKFLMIILRIAVFFAPLKIFTPASILFFLTGLSWYLFRVFGQGRPFPPVSSLLMITAVLIFFIGLVSEQIANLRYARTGINNS